MSSALKRIPDISRASWVFYLSVVCHHKDRLKIFDNQKPHLHFAQLKRPSSVGKPFNVSYSKAYTSYTANFLSHFSPYLLYYYTKQRDHKKGSFNLLFFFLLLSMPHKRPPIEENCNSRLWCEHYAIVGFILAHFTFMFVLLAHCLSHFFSFLVAPRRRFLLKAYCKKNRSPGAQWG